MNRCLFCGEDVRDTAAHLRVCDGRQGHIEGDDASREAATRMSVRGPSPHPSPDFDGVTYERERDQDRLRAQLGRVRAAMLDHAWHTLPGLSNTTGDPEASISARLRDLRKEKFGGYTVERRYLDGGLWEYRLLPRADVEAAS